MRAGLTSRTNPHFIRNTWYFGDTMSSPWPFIGRDVALTHLVDQLINGADTRGIMLQGPAGIGKTALLNHVAERLDLEGRAPLHVRGSSAASAVPFGPFAPLFSEFAITQTDGFAALSALSTALAQQASQAVLLVDDVGRMDHASILAIQQIMRSARIPALLTVRVGEAPDAINELCDQGIIRVEQVEPLSTADVQRIAAGHLGAPLSPRATTALVGHVDGNPLHLRELLMASHLEGNLKRSGAFVELSGELAVGQRITELMGRRFDALESEALEVLETLAAGQPLIAASFESSIVDQLERAGLIERSVTDELRLAHPLYDDVLRARATPSWWRTTQARTAALLRASVEDKPKTDPAVKDLLHRAIVLDVAAGTPTVPEELAGAAAWAIGQTDPVLAAQLASRALESQSLHLAHLVLGVASGTLGNLDLAESELRNAIETASNDDDLARLAGPVGHFWGTRRQDPRAALRMLDQLVERLSTPQPSPTIRSEIAFWLMMTGQPQGELFPETGDEIDQLSIAVNQSVAGVVAGPLEIVEPAVTHGIPLALKHREKFPHALPFLKFSHVTGTALSGNLKGARTLTQEYLDSEDLVGVESSGIWQQLLGHLELSLGNIDSAHNLAIDAERNLSWRDVGGVLPAAKALLVATATHRGSSRERTRALKELTLDGPRELRVVMLLGWAQARALRDDGDIEGAALHAYTVGQELIDGNHMYLGALLMHVAVRLGQPVPVVETLAHVVKQSGGGLVELLHDHAVAIRDHNPIALEQLVDRMTELGAVSLAADAATQLTVWLDGQGQPFPTRTWLEDLSDLRTQAGTCGPWTKPFRAEPDPFLLTKRESDVAHLAATRLRSREIAETLGISVRTVDNHLNNVYRKLGVKTRTELADALTDM